VARITGPSHNLLGIEFGENFGSSGAVVVEPLPNKSQHAALLSPREVRKNVLLGVADANQEFGKAYIVKRIEFISTDSPPSEIYRVLARSIIERLVNQQTFDEGI